jgi:excisionase family DNA binding protein
MGESSDRELLLGGSVPELLTVHELSSLLKISHRSIWRLVRSGGLPAPLRLGSSSRWRSDEIRVWMNDCGREANGHPPPS